MTHFRRGMIEGTVVSIVLAVGAFWILAGCSTSIKAIAESNVGPFHSSASVEAHESRPFSATLDIANDPWSSSVTYGPITVSSSIGLSGTANKLAALTMALAPTNPGAGAD